MATTSIGAPGVTFPDGTVQASSGATGSVVMNVYTSTTPGQVWTKPATVKAIKVTVVGGGGSGGNSARGTSFPVGLTSTRNGGQGGGGGGGGYAQKIYPGPSIPGPQPFTVGGTASTSSFGSTVTVVSATGGASGGSATGAPGPSQTTAYGGGGAGGAGSNGDLNIPGGAGTAGQGDQKGGTSILSNNEAGYISPNSPGVAGNVYGGGASGSTVTSSGAPLSATGGTGAQGIVIIEEFY